MKQTELERLLPGVFQQTAVEPNPLRVILGFMEDLHGPSETALEQLDRFFDPRRTPEAFVAYLAGWVDLAWVVLAAPESPWPQTPPPYPPGVGRLRELVGQAPLHAKLRGTRQGLVSLLETATGVQGFEIDAAAEGPGSRPFHIKVRVPGAALPYSDLVRRIVEHEKPAHVTSEIEPIPETGTSDGTSGGVGDATEDG